MNSLENRLVGKIGSKGRRWGVVALVGLFAGAGATYVYRNSELIDKWQGRNTIVELKEVPQGVIETRGVVTYLDREKKRFWLQDETGAVEIDQDPVGAGVKFGETVLVRMRKTHAYDAVAGAASMGLRDFKVERARRKLPMPVPVAGAISTLSDVAKNGIRVKAEGVVHGVSARGDGKVAVEVGDEGSEVEAVVPGVPGDFASWVDVTVRVTGALEILLDKNGIPTSELIWTENPTDLVKTVDAPAAGAMTTIRALYAENEHIGAHAVRLRGRVLYQEARDQLLVEDESAAIGCRLETSGFFAPGAAVEVVGFAKRDGLRVDLSHTVAKTISNDEVPEWRGLAGTTTIADLRATSEGILRTMPPVKVTGVITWITPDYRQFFLQDATAGIFVKYAATPVSLYPGEKITAIGLAKPGDFAPVIVAPKFQSLGTAALPVPKQMDQQARFGVLDSLYSEAVGVVHPRQGELQTLFDLYTSIGPIHVGVMHHAAGDDVMSGLQDATVRVRGVAGEVFNSRGQLVGLQMALDDMKGIEVIEPGRPDPFGMAATPINTLLKFSPHARPDHMVVVAGAVTALGNGFFYIQDATGGIRIESAQSGLAVGDVVEAAGFANATGYSPALTDAIVRAEHKSSTIRPQQVTADMMSNGRFDSQLVSIEAMLLSSESSAGARTLSVISAGHTFQAVLYPRDTGEVFTPPEQGSILRLTGICSVVLEQGRSDNLLRKDAVEFRLILPSASDVKVVRGGSWWTLRHSLAVVGTLVLVVLISLGRIAVLLYQIRHKNEQLRKAEENESAVRQLVGAMQEVRTNKQFTSRVSLPEADELAMLGVEFNHMLEELQIRDDGMAEAEAKLQQQALSDALTGLPNRRLFSDRLAQGIASSSRDGTMVAIIYIDLDGFKLVNDSYGHNFGDLLLISVTERLSSRVRKADTLSRLGGDEFAIALSGLKTVENAEQMAQILLHMLQTPFQIEGQEVRIGASMGISVFPRDANSGSELLQYADSAMYAAKRSGKNRVVVFTSNLGESMREHTTIENQLRHAIDAGEIAVYYQPEFEVGSQGLVRFEALARWNHATLGNIPPSTFIPIAEESGLILPLGAYVMERACTDCLGWQSRDDPPVQVAVNVSIVQFGRDSFVSEVEAILKKTGLDPSLLQIELTESVTLSGIEDAAQKITSLQKLGISVAVDDFGTGYSALSYIATLPFNALKIDRSFMKEIMRRTESRAMVQSIVVLAQQLGMKVIVEGVENEEQLGAIQELGADAVQGFLLGRPTPDPAAHLTHRLYEAVEHAMRDGAFQVPEAIETP